MTEPFLPDTVSLAMSGTAIAGVVTHAVTLWFRERASEQKRDHDEQERLSQTLAKWADQARRESTECMERWRESQVEIRALASDLAKLQAEHAVCPKRIRALEDRIAAYDRQRTPTTEEWQRDIEAHPDLWRAVKEHQR